jgi:hypothetical protein
MLSTIVFCDATYDRQPNLVADMMLVRTLGSLVTANVEGLLRDVAIAGPAGRGLAAIAHHAGCGLIEADSEAGWLFQAIEAARGPDVLLLRSGRAPGTGFIEEAGDLLEARTLAKDAGSQGRRLLRFAMRDAPEKFVERLFPRLAPVAALIAPRELCLRAPAGRFDALVHFVNPAITLRTRARRVG